MKRFLRWLFGKEFDRTMENVRSEEREFAKKKYYRQNIANLESIANLLAEASLLHEQKTELQEKLEKFTKPNNKPMILEIFTDAYTDAENLKNFWEVNKKLTFKGKTKKVIKKIVGEKGKETIKKFLKRG